MTAFASRYFVTGTDTDVGKSVVTASLAIAFQEKGIPCLAVKPVQTGLDANMDDQSLYDTFTGQTISHQGDSDRAFFRLRLPASPHLAAERENLMLNVEDIIRRIDGVQTAGQILLIEGAGGLLVPLNRSETMLNLIAAAEASTILVSRNALGTLNHTALTLHELERNGLAPSAVVICDTSEIADPSEQMIRDDNVEQIIRMAGGIPVVRFPHCREIDRAYLLAHGTLLTDALSRS